MWLFTDRDGNITIVYPADVTPINVTATAPSDITVQLARPSAVQYRKRTYVVGQFSPGLVYTEFGGLHALGIAPPQTTPILTASGAGTTGAAIGVLTFGQRVSGKLIHESGPSALSNTLQLTSQGRLWTGLPTTSTSVRVNVLRGHVSMDGAEFRFAWERQLGVSSVTEGVATLALGEAISEKRGVPPYSRYIEMFHDRAWYAGNPAFPDRVYYSEIGEPESVGGLNFIPTRDGETITGIKRVRDYLVVFCRKCTYTIQGFTEADFDMRKASPNIGCISYGSIVNIDDRLWFASEDGVYLFDGSFKFLMDNLRTYWRDAYLTNAASKARYEDSIGVDDRFRKIYKLLVIQPQSPLSFYYCGYYGEFAPELEGSKSQPDWSFDVRIREDSGLGLLLSDNSMRDELYTGSCDGGIRKENVAADPGDSGDDKIVTIRTGHFLYNDPGGGRNHGKSVTDLDVYLESENQAWTLNLFGGDENAYQALAPMFTATRAASALTITGHDYLPQTVHHFRPTGTSGRGFTFEVVVSNPVGLEYRGLGGAWKIGGATRPRLT